MNLRRVGTASLFVVMLVVSSLGWAASAGAVPAHAGKTFTTSLVGANEVPGPGDPDGSGEAVLVLNAGQGTICFELTVEGIAPANAAHIHVADAGVAGPVVVPLAAPTDGSSSGCATVDRDVIRAILTNPAGYYVNVHNAEFPAGALRGQLGR